MTKRKFVKSDLEDDGSEPKHTDDHKEKLKIKILLKECKDQIDGVLAPSKDRVDALKKVRDELNEKLKVLQAKIFLAKVKLAEKTVNDSVRPKPCKFKNEDSNETMDPKDMLGERMPSDNLERENNDKNCF